MPPTKTRREPPEVYQLHISLDEIRPLVWRRVLVSSAATLAQLHAVIQGSFRWTNDHLHEFDTPRGSFTSSAFEELLADAPELRASSGVRLRQVFAAPGASIYYTYDYGDGWGHIITLEQRLLAVQGVKYPVVINGARRGPMEDCGGPFAYMQLVDIMNEGPRDEEKLEMIKYVEHFEPEEFDVEACNKRLAGYCESRMLERLPLTKKSAGKSKKEE